MNALRKLPEQKGEQVADFADFMLKKMEEDALQTGIQYTIENSGAFSFLNEKEEVYTLDDLKERF